MSNPNTTARLLITCPDKPGIVSAVSSFLYNHGANITDLDQHSTEAEGGTYFMRLEFQTPHLDLSRQVLGKAFEEAVASRYNMDWRISYATDVKKVAILVSKFDHALLELLWRSSRGMFTCEHVTPMPAHTFTPCAQAPIWPEMVHGVPAPVQALVGTEGAPPQLSPDHARLVATLEDHALLYAHLVAVQLYAAAESDVRFG